MSPRSPRAPGPDDLLDVVAISDSDYRPAELALSPDGSQVVFRRRQALPAANAYTIDLWLISANGGPARRLTEHEPVAAPYTTFRAAWSPDSRRVAYVAPGDAAIRLVDLTGAVEEVAVDGAEVGPAALRWSPDGRSLAFVRTGPAGPSVTDPWRSAASGDGKPMRGLDLDPARGSMPALRIPPPRQELVVIDLTTGTFDQIGPPELNVDGFDWSPDGAALVVSGSTTQTGYPAEIRSSLYVVERASGDIRPLVVQGGADELPVWSPDGRWIAFVSHRGRESWKAGGIPAVVPAAGGEPRYPTGHLCEELFEAGRPFWSADSAQLYFPCPYRLGRHLFAVPVDGGSAAVRPAQLTPAGDAWYSAFSAAGDRVAFVRESPVQPQELYLGELADLRPTKLTTLNAGLTEDIASVQLRHLSWRSRDDRYDIHGLLLLPPEHREGDRHPLLVEAVGGPTMVRAAFGSHAFPVPAMVARGYAVLVPNTRGRGGFGETFERAIELEGSEVAAGWLDLEAGVDQVIEQGYADPARLGVMGHSYGAVLTAYGITQTGRYRAAAFHEGVVDLPGAQAWQWDTADNKVRLREYSGHGSPFDPVEFDKLRAESPMHNLYRVTTPVLIECGEQSLVTREGAVLANGLADRGIPCEFVVYPRTGHVTTEPALLRDDWQRDLSWFDYWLRDVPLPDAGRQQLYDAWRARADRDPPSAERRSDFED